MNIDYILSIKADYYIGGTLLIDIEEFNLLEYKGGIHPLVYTLGQHLSALKKPIAVDVYNSKKCNLVRDNNGNIITTSDLSRRGDLDGHTIIIRLFSKIKKGRRHQLSEEYLSFLQQTISKERENLKNRKQKEFYENIKEYHKIYENRDIEDIEKRSKKNMIERKTKDSWI